MDATPLRRPPVAPTRRPAPARADVERRVLGSLAFVVPKDRPAPAYAVAVSLLAACLVLMPVLYGGLVAFLAWLAAWHVVNAVTSLSAGPYFLYHLPMAAGAGLLVVFLVKPVFFGRAGKEAGVVTLTAEGQPLLFAAVGRLCEATGARPPSAIEVDCEPNAHARFRRFADSVSGRDLVLRIGLPLAAGLSARQLLGVVGHELGHFNQRRGMAGSYLIRRLSGFFARVVFHRDRVDAWVADLGRRPHGAARLAHALAVALVEPMRGVLWLMLTAAQLLTCGALRRMEHDADEVEAHVCGGADFVRTAKLLTFLGIAHEQARADLARAIAHRRLADDLPRLIVANAKQLGEHRSDVMRVLKGMRTRWFDTHPCYAERVAHVDRMDAAGLFDCDLPASRLFADFRGLCRQATDAFYVGTCGAEDLVGAEIVATEPLVAERAERRAATRVLRRYFRGHVVAGRPMFPIADGVGRPVSDVPRAAARLATARRSVEDAAAAGDALPTTIRQYVEAATLLPYVNAQLSLCELFRRNARARAVAARADRLRAEHQPALIRARAVLKPFEEVGRQRLTLALRLVRTDAVAGGFGGDVSACRATVSKLLRVCDGLEAALPAAGRLGEVLPAVRVLAASHNPGQPHPPLVHQILTHTAEAVRLLGEMTAMLGDVPYPFEHGTAGVTVAAHVVQAAPDSRDPTATYQAGTAALERYHELTFRTLAVLTLWAERAEAAAGLPPLGDVAEPADAAAESAVVDRAASRRTRRYWIAYGGRAAAGLALVAGLVGVSVSPPSVPWGDRSGGRTEYRPAAFHVGSGLSPTYRSNLRLLPPLRLPPLTPPALPPTFGSGRPPGFAFPPPRPSFTPTPMTQWTPPHTPPTFRPPGQPGFPRPMRMPGAATPGFPPTVGPRGGRR